MFNEIIEWLETHDGKMPRGAIKIRGKQLKINDMTEEQKYEVRLYDKWKDSTERKVLLEYKGKPIEEVPEEYRDKIKMLRSYGLGLVEGKTTYEKVIEWMEMHEGKFPRSTIKAKGKSIKRNEMTEEQKYEVRLFGEWKKTEEKRVFNKYKGRPIEEVPEEFREKIAELRRLRKPIEEKEEQKVDIKKILGEYKGRPIEEVPEKYQEKIAELRKNGLGLTTYEEVIKFMDEHEGKTPRSIKTLAEDRTKEEKYENNLYARWQQSDEYKILKTYVGKPIEEVPIEHREKVAELRNRGLGLEKKEINYIEYQGQKLSLEAISKLEDVNAKTLRKYYELYGNIEKAVFIAKRKKRKFELSREKSKLKNGEVDSNSAEVVQKMKDAGKKIILKSGQDLLSYCVENEINYSCIYYSVTTYGKTLEEAIEYYKKHGQSIPKNWIYERYGVLLRHLALQEHIHIDRVIRYMHEETISLDDAIKKYIVRNNAKEKGLDQDWLEELYDVFTDEAMTDEYDDFKKGFYVDDEEENCIIESMDRFDEIHRKIDLFEIFRVIEEGAFKPEEEHELLKQYDVKPKEIEMIFLELYSRFDRGVLLGQDQPEQQHRNTINEIIRNWKELTPEEKEKTLKSHNISPQEQRYIEKISGQIVKYKGMVEDDSIIELMRGTVGRNVGANAETRTTLNSEMIKTEETKGKGEK